jgi:3-dehydroquinate synthetase
LARFGRSILPRLGERVGSLDPSACLTVADQTVIDLHGAPADGPVIAIEGGEKAKSFGGWRALLDGFIEHGLDRDALVLAFGGGTVLDLAGFAAAAYLRGIRWIALPTTLLAQVDAAHGGKTAIDHPAAKNLVGAFHEPVEVWSDTDLLSTLPEREVRGGLAEVIKHAVIGAPGLLERAGRDDPAAFVEEAANVKLQIVARDPFEQGERRLLNLGHTLGHAIERAGGYDLHHGEAVAIGLRAACAIAERHCGFTERAPVEEALDRCNLPVRASASEEEVLRALRHDKKRSRSVQRWVLPVALGDVRVFDDVPEDLVIASLRETLAAS